MLSFFLNFYENFQFFRCHPVQDYHTLTPFQHKRSTKQAKHETKNKQKAT
jgi:hypothetical protein